jgi:hypothetical protein
MSPPRQPWRTWELSRGVLTSSTMVFLLFPDSAAAAADGDLDGGLGLRSSRRPSWPARSRPASWPDGCGWRAICRPAAGPKVKVATAGSGLPAASSMMRRRRAHRPRRHGIAVLGDFRGGHGDAAGTGSGAPGEGLRSVLPRSRRKTGPATTWRRKRCRQGQAKGLCVWKVSWSPPCFGPAVIP